MTVDTESKLGERELDILSVLWQLGRASVAEVHAALQNRGHQVAYTTIQTMLNRLEAKGIVSRDISSRTHYYRPILKQRTVLSRAIQRVADRFFEGSVSALASHLVGYNLSRKQLGKIKNLTHDLEKKKSKQ